MMRRVCAWCKKELMTKEKYASEGHITHGICSLCAIKVTGFEPRTAKQLLNYVQEPVFVIDSDGIVKAANQSGLRMLGKEMAEIENELGGDAFECSYASSEGGCGNTVHCKTCAIRNIVMDTLIQEDTIGKVAMVAAKALFFKNVRLLSMAAPPFYVFKMCFVIFKIA